VTKWRVLPLSVEAQKKLVISWLKQKLAQASKGDPIVSAKLLDIALGCYWMTKACRW
jgi:hypothetical protein